jgi:hypothetical protein
MPLTLKALAHVCFKNKIITFSFPHMGVYPSGKDHDFSSNQCLEMKLSLNENCVKTNDYIWGIFEI